MTDRTTPETDPVAGALAQILEQLQSMDERLGQLEAERPTAAADVVLGPAPASVPSDDGDHGDPAAAPAEAGGAGVLTRRNLITGVTALGAAGAVLLSGAQPAAAANGDPVLAGGTTTATAVTTLTANLPNTATLNAANPATGNAAAVYGVAGTSANIGGFGAIVGDSSGRPGLVGLSNADHGVVGRSNSQAGVFGTTASSASTSAGVTGFADGTSSGVRAENQGIGPGLFAISPSGNAVYATSVLDTAVLALSEGPAAVYGNNQSGSADAMGVGGQTTTGTGVLGLATSGTGVTGRATTGTGARGDSTNGVGVRATSQQGFGLVAMTTSGEVGLYASNNSSAVGDSAIKGLSTGGATAVFGTCNSSGPGVVATSQSGTALRASSSSGVGAAIFGPTVHLRLAAAIGRPAPNLDATAHAAGDFVVDGDRILWFCVADGTPGTWRRLAGPTSAGQFHVLPAPARIADSRPGGVPTSVVPKTPIAAGSTRVFDLKVNNSGVPAGATAALMTVLLVNASNGNGNLTVWANGVAKPTANTMVWGAGSGRWTATAVTALDSQARIQVNASAQTDIVLDVVGYYL